MPWQIYIIQCRDNTLYTGITNDLQGRIDKHNSGKACKYTRSRQPVRLLHSEEFSTKSQALKREAQIKALSRAEKLALIEHLSQFHDKT